MVTYLLGLVRLKALALLLGPSGVGLFGYLQAASGMLGTLTNLGVASSGVRDVAEAQATADSARMSRTVSVLRRVCWVTGTAGLLAAVLVAWPLSMWSFGEPRQAGAIALLGFSLLFAAISAGQTAYLQGLRRIGDLACINIAGIAFGTAASVACYFFLGASGIALGLVLSAAVTLLCSWWFARRVPVPRVRLAWRETWTHARPLIKLGLAFAWSGLLVAGVGLLTRSLIVRDLGIEANGLYQAAWAISGLFAGFILGAMGADFYPRLTAIARDHEAVNRLVNEQTEIGLLLALPGLVGTLAFGSEVLRILYSAQFLPAAELLPWFVLGVLGRVISWPVSYLLLAKGAARWFFVTETLGNVVGVAALLVLLKFQGLVGVAMAFAVLYFAYTAIVLCVGRHLTSFIWSSSVISIGAVTVVALAIALLLNVMTGYWRYLASVGLLVITLVYSLHGLVKRLGPDHKISKLTVGIFYAIGIK